MEMDASLKEYQAALDAQFEERKAMILSQEEKDLAVEVEAVKRQGNQKLAHEHLVNKRALSQKETEFKDKLFQEVAALVEDYKKTPEYVEVIKKQIIDAKSFAKNDDIIIYLDPADASKKHDLEEETKCTLTMSEYSFGGGMRAVIPARSILIDNSMDSRIAEVRNEFQFDGGNTMAADVKGIIYGINGPVIYIKGKTAFRMGEMVYVGPQKLVGEVIRLDSSRTTIQVYEETTGLKPGDEVYSTGAAISVTLAPGILHNIFDGIERPLSEIAKAGGMYITRGLSVDALDRSKKWQAHITVKPGQHVFGGTVIAEVQETPMIVHKCMLPPDTEGTVESVANDGEYTIDETIVTIIQNDGTKKELSMTQKWPIRVPRPTNKRYAASEPLITGQRILDTLFPIAKGGTAAIPGGFGTGKTMTQHQVAKWSDADIIVYIGCGERGNEMTQVLEEFSELIDPKSGNPLMDRTVLIANTSNMPVAAREASIYTGLTLAEYYRDMGYHVAIMADSTSRWAEALRELSGRLEEMPAEEGFPAYLASKLSAFYERAGMMHNLNGSVGSVTIIGAVSPQGSDFSEPVTQNTKRFVRCFWGLDKSLAYARHFPAIHWLTSYSEYVQDLAPWYNAKAGKDFIANRTRLMAILNQESALMEIVKLIGSDVLPDDQKLTLEIARVVRLGYLQQNAFHKDDTCVPIEKQAAQMRVILYLYDRARSLVTMGHPMSVLKQSNIFDRVINIKYDVPNDRLDMFDQYMKDIDTFYDEVIEKNA